MNGPAVSVGQAVVNSENESWNRVHAQLLKSVADAQARLLAGINEVSDKLDGQKPQEPRTATEMMTLEHEKERAERFYAAILGLPEKLDDLKVLVAQTQEAVRNSHGTLTGRLDAIGSVLAELLQMKSYRTRPKSKRRR